MSVAIGIHLTMVTTHIKSEHVMSNSGMRWARESFPGASALAVATLAEHGLQGFQASLPTVYLGGGKMKRLSYRYLEEEKFQRR